MTTSALTTGFFVPPLYDLVWSIVPLVLLVAVVASLISLIRNGRTLSPRDLVFWAIFIVVIPVVGAIAWFALGRPALRKKAMHRELSASR